MTSSTRKACLFLVDDHPAVRHGLVRLLGDESYEVCGEAGGAADTLQAVVDAQADLVIVDLSLGDESGFDLIAELSARKIPTLVYSMHEDAANIDQSLRGGASGYVSKREESEILCQAVQALLDGQRYISPQALRALSDRSKSTGSDGDTTQLSEREQQIMSQFALGHGPSDVAKILSISVRTVESYSSRIIEKLEVANMKELRQHAIRNQRYRP